jgi:tetratricopeptide (TPR) repeat protein
MERMTLAELRAGVERARAVGGEALAGALIELAEAEPVLGHRQAAVRAPLEEAAALLDGLGAPSLEGRALLRLAHVKLSEGDLEGVEQLAARARDRFASPAERAATALALADAGSLVARAQIRRKDFAQAQAQLIAISDGLDGEPETVVARRVVAHIALAWAELALEQQDYAEAASRLDVLGSGLPAGDGGTAVEDLIELGHACRQARAVVALALGDAGRACRALREVVAIANRFGSIEDELEARVALAGALVQRGDPVGRDEAERHLQVVRDQALEHELDSVHMSALVGQAGLLAHGGQTQGALARCIEIASAAVKLGDLPRYAAAVALMSQIYEQRGDLASAYRTFAEARASLRDQLGDAARDVLRPHITAFADRIGHTKFAEIAEAVNKAAHARQTFRRRS